MSAAKLLELRGVSVSYPSEDGTVPVLRDVSLEVVAGDTVGVVGESGSGKTVLARVILGLLDSPLTLDGGSIVFEGRELVGLEEEALRRLRGRSIALTTPEPRKHLNPLMRVGSQLVNVIRAHQNASRREALERAVELLRSVGIPDPASRIRSYPHELSGGMCQRVIIAMALAHQTKLLLVDEPTAGLDVTISRQVLDLMGDLVHQHHTALLLVSRDLGVVAHYCRRVAVMYAGRVVEVADVNAFFDAPVHPYSRQLLRAATAARDSAAIVARASALLPPATVGCAYAPRCPVAQDGCRGGVPPLESVATGREVRCRRAAALMAGELAA
jgi:peptide/nickel transport system ATP-binding protein